MFFFLISIIILNRNFTFYIAKFFSNKYCPTNPNITNPVRKIYGALIINNTGDSNGTIIAPTNTPTTIINIDILLALRFLIFAILYFLLYPPTYLSFNFN